MHWYLKAIGNSSDRKLMRSRAHANQKLYDLKICNLIVIYKGTILRDDFEYNKVSISNILFFN